MIKSIRHLRGNEADWAANDIIIPDGEIALVRTGGGNTKIKIGDGTRHFSALPSLIGNTITADMQSIKIEHGISYRLGTQYSIAAELPEKPDADFFAEVSFDSGRDATDFSVSGEITFTGDGTADGDFMPEANTHYTVFIWYDGSYQGVIRGVPHA